MPRAHVSTVLGDVVRGLALVGALAGAGALLWHASWQTRGAIALALVSVSPVALAMVPGVWWRRAPPPPDATDDLARRRPVWSVLSDLYLDTELTEANLRGMGSQLARSGYDVAQLEEILFCEVHPVLVANLMSVAGEWACFDMDRVEARILRRAPHRSGFAIVLGKWMVKDPWRAVRRHIEAVER